MKVTEMTDAQLEAYKKAFEGFDTPAAHTARGEVNAELEKRAAERKKAAEEKAAKEAEAKAEADAKAKEEARLAEKVLRTKQHNILGKCYKYKSSETYAKVRGVVDDTVFLEIVTTAQAAGYATSYRSVRVKGIDKFLEDTKEIPAYVYDEKVAKVQETYDKAQEDFNRAFEKASKFVSSLFEDWF